jgi:hypothetical protein
VWALSFELAAGSRNRQLARPFSPDFAWGFVVAQADKDGVTEQPVVSPGEIGDLGNENGLNPMDARQREATAEARLARRRDGERGGGLPRREAGESEDSFRRRMAAELDAERSARCSFWEVGRLVASTDGRAFLCDECEASAHVVMTETPVPPPIVREPIRVDWRKLPHHQTYGPR